MYASRQINTDAHTYTCTYLQKKMNTKLLQMKYKKKKKYKENKRKNISIDNCI